MSNNRELTMLMVGDVRVVRENPPTAFQHIGGMLREADFTLGNLEGAHADSGTPWLKEVGHNWKSDARQMAAVESAGFDAMNVANNHAMDFGYDALFETMGHLDRLGIGHTGGGRNFAEAHAPAIVERHGCRVALLGSTALYIRGWEAGPQSPGLAVMRGGTAYQPAPNFFEGPGRPPIIRSWILPEDKAQLSADIAAARSKADIVVCTFHWGVSSGFIKLTEYQVDLGHHAIDAGADVVFGHHPHVLQGIEIYKGRPIFYSLGNFLVDSHSRHAPEKMVARCRIRDKRITSVDFVPVLDEERNPRAVDVKKGQIVIDRVKERSVQFETQFIEEGDSVRIPTGSA